VPFSFLLILAFMLCALVSPLVGAGVVWALCAKRWRHAGERAGTAGGIFAVKFMVTYVALHALFGNDVPMQPMSVAVAGGAGFTAGALGACIWTWMKSGPMSGRANAAAPVDIPEP
jgi:hypothetical protein